MSWNRLTLPAILLIPFLFFLFFHEQLLSGHDSANFVLMLRYGFDVAASRPHAPGYPGFYVLWYAMRAMTGLSEHSVILAGNLVFTVISIWLGYWATLRMFDTRTAILTALLIATNPLTLYYSSVSEVYAYDAAFSAFVVVLLLAPPRRYEIVLYFIYGLLGGFRLSSVMLTVPVVGLVLLFRALREHAWKPFGLKMGMITLGTLCWLVPFAMQLGGFNQWLVVLRGAGAFAGSFAQNIGIFLPSAVWMLNVCSILIIVHWRQIWHVLRDNRPHYRILAWLTIVPLLFFVFFCYSKGYALLYVVPLMMLLARLILRSKNSTVITCCAVAANLAIVFAVPFIPPSIRSALNHEHRTSTERWESAALRGTSFFAPTLAHLRASDENMHAALDLLRALPDQAFVAVDNAAALYAYPRALQAVYPHLQFIMPRLDDTAHVLYYNADSMRYDYHYSDISLQAPLYYLTTADLMNEIGAPSGVLLYSEDELLLYRINSGDRSQLFQRLQIYFARTAGK